MLVQGEEGRGDVGGDVRVAPCRRGWCWLCAVCGLKCAMQRDCDANTTRIINIEPRSPLTIFARLHCHRTSVDSGLVRAWTRIRCTARKSALRLIVKSSETSKCKNHKIRQPLGLCQYVITPGQLFAVYAMRRYRSV